MVTRDVHREWVLLSYRLPREPSSPRIAHWRALRRLGAARIHDGLAALPFSEHTQEQLEWLAEAVGEAGGTAQVWVARLTGAEDERVLVGAMRTASSREYRLLASEARTMAVERETDTRAIGRLRRELRRIRGRDYFGAPGRDAAERAIESLARRVVAAA